MASISHKLKLIYIEVPKTGTTSFRQALKTVDPDLEMISHRHSNAIETKKALNDDKIWDKYTKIGFIRHPDDWITSLLNFPMIYTVVVKDRTPYDWFLDENGVIAIDNVYRTEDMDQIMADMGLPVLRLNVRNFDRSDFIRNMIYIPPDVTDVKFSRELAHYSKKTIDDNKSAVKFKKNGN